MLRLENIGKQYKSKVALQDVCTELDRGVIGLLGPNGAGKTTLLRILASVLKPSTGEIYWKGKRITDKNLTSYRDLLGYMPQELRFYDMQTVCSYLTYYEVLDGNTEKSEIRSKIDETLGLLNLTDQKNVKIKGISGGMKRRLGFAQAIIRRPQILILDEPTVGLDPGERRNLRKVVSDYGRDHIVILSTHLTEDIESVCDRILLLEQGRLFADTNVDAMIGKTQGHIFERKKRQNEESCVRGEVISVRHTGDWEIERYISDQSNEEITRGAVSVSPNLEDAYLYHRYRFKCKH